MHADMYAYNYIYIESWTSGQGPTLNVIYFVYTLNI